MRERLSETLYRAAGVVHCAACDGVLGPAVDNPRQSCLVRRRELAVPLAGEEPLDQARLAALVAAFRRRYERRYGAGAAAEQTPYEVLNLRVDAVATSGFAWRSEPRSFGTADPAAAHMGERAVWWPSLGRRQATPIYRRDRLAPGHVVVGPAVVEMYGSTVPLHPGQRCRVDAWRNLIVTAE